MKSITSKVKSAINGDKKGAKNRIREATLGASRPKKSVCIEIEGTQIEVRQPTIGQRNDLIEKSIILTDAGSKTDPTAHQIWCVLFFAYVPGTDIRVFDESDYDTLTKSAPGGYVDLIFEEYLKLANQETTSEIKND